MLFQIMLLGMILCHACRCMGYICEGAQACERACLHIPVLRPKQDTRNSALLCSAPFPETHSLTDPGAPRFLARLAGEQDPKICLFLRHCTEVHVAMLFVVWVLVI